MELLDKDNKEVKKTRIEGDAEIYNKDREDPSPEERWKSMSRKEKLLYYKVTCRKKQWNLFFFNKK